MKHLRILRPRSLEKLCQKALKPSLILWSIFFLSGTLFALFLSPPDYQQKEMVRFLYIHVPASWFALFCYGLMALLSLFTVTLKSPQTALLTKALAIPGALFASISLITGSLWGKPTWGTYWAWDARLTSMLILFFIYLGYIAIVYAKRVRPSTLHTASFLVIIGVINLPIIKWSVHFWTTLHQPPSIMRLGRPALAVEFWPPLILMTLAYACFLIAMTSSLFLKEMVKARKVSHSKEVLHTLILEDAHPNKAA